MTNNPYKAPNAPLDYRKSIPVYELLLSFEGRIGRRDFWLGFCVILVTSVVLVLVIKFWPFYAPEQYAVLTLMLYPLLAVSAKRYHDQAKSGWMSLIWLAPFVGWMFAIIECGFTKGYPMRNKYGPPRFGPLADRDP